MNIYSKLFTGLVFFSFMTMIEASFIADFERVIGYSGAERESDLDRTHLRQELSNALDVFKEGNSVEPAELTPEIVDSYIAALNVLSVSDPEVCVGALRAVALYMQGNGSFGKWITEFSKKSDLHHDRIIILRALVEMLVANALNYKRSSLSWASGRVIVSDASSAASASSASASGGISAELPSVVVNGFIEKLLKLFVRDPVTCASAICGAVLCMYRTPQYQSWLTEFTGRPDVLSQGKHQRRMHLGRLTEMRVRNARNYNGSSLSRSQGRVLVAAGSPDVSAASASCGARSSFFSTASAAGGSTIQESDSCSDRGSDSGASIGSAAEVEE